MGRPAMGASGWQPVGVIDDYAKEKLHEALRWRRDALVWKLDGLSEYDIRRPLTATGTNLLGLVKHCAYSTARYLGEIFDRPRQRAAVGRPSSVERRALGHRTRDPQ